MFQIAPSVQQIPLGPFQGLNAYLVGDVLVDAGVIWSRRKLLTLLTGKRLTGHLVTHAHLDHQGATHAVCDAFNLPLICHPLEKEPLETGQITGSYPSPDSAYARFQQRFLAGLPHPVARTVTQGDSVAGFTVIDAPGHTPGQIALWRESDRTLIAADAAVNMRGLRLPPKISSTDLVQARATLQKLAALNPGRVAFGHGPVATGAAFADFVAAL